MRGVRRIFVALALMLAYTGVVLLRFSRVTTQCVANLVLSYRSPGVQFGEAREPSLQT
jgi:hypothetical protein